MKSTEILSLGTKSGNEGDHHKVGGHVDSGINSTHLLVLGVLAGGLSGCGDTINNYYDYIETYPYTIDESPSEGDTEFLDPSECGVVPNVDGIGEMTPFAFYGDHGTTITILMDEENYVLLNENFVNGYDDGVEDGWIDYGVGDNQENSGGAFATVCITSPDGTETACVEGASIKLAGGMTATQWCGDGVGSDYEEEMWWCGEPTIPVLNIDLNETDHDAKIHDTVTGREIDNIRLNSGQYLGLARAAVDYKILGDMGLPTRLTTFVNVESNVWGLNGDGTGCVMVPELNMMRDQDGLACEYNEDTLDPSNTRDCEYGFEGYTLYDASCEWSDTEDENGDPVCDEEGLSNWMSAIDQNAYTTNYAVAVSDYVDNDQIIGSLCGEFATNFWDGNRVGNNLITPCLHDGTNCQYGLEPYSVDYALFPQSWAPELPSEAVGGLQSMTRGYVEDPSTCQKVVETCSEKVNILATVCLSRVAEARTALEQNGMWRGAPDEETDSNLQQFCTDFPGQARTTLDGLSGYCMILSDTGADTSWDTASDSGVVIFK